MDVFYWEDKEKQIDFLLNESQSQAKEIEGLREWKDKAIKLIEPSIEQSKGVLEDCDSEYWSDRANKIIDEGKNLLSQDTTQPDKGGKRNANRNRQHRTK